MVEQILHLSVPAVISSLFCLNEFWTQFWLIVSLY